MKWDHGIWRCLRASASDGCETLPHVQRLSSCAVLVSIAVSLSSRLWIWKRPLAGWRLWTFVVQLRDWWWLLKTELFGLGTMSTAYCIEMSVPLAASAMQALFTVDRVAAGCSAMAPTDYTDRHNQVASIIHWNICRHLQVPVESRWYRHQPDRLVNKETEGIMAMWDTAIPTARKMKANRPHTCFRNEKDNTCHLIHISCPTDGKVGRKHAAKFARYSDVRVEISRMWQCRTRVVPVVLGALGTVHAGIARWLDIILGHHNLQHLQKEVLLGSAWILHKVMSSSV